MVNPIWYLSNITSPIRIFQKVLLIALPLFMTSMYLLTVNMWSPSSFPRVKSGFLTEIFYHPSLRIVGT